MMRCWQLAGIMENRMQVVKRIIGVLVLLCAASGAAAQEAPVAVVPAPLAQPADVASVDAILASLYDTISGPAGAPRDWARLRSLFAPGGRLVAVGPAPEGGFRARNMSVEDYIARVAPVFAKTGFYEKEAARTSDSFGQIVQVFSTYESRHAQTDAVPFQRGINSIQLYHDGKRWWIVNLLWRAEDDKLPLPERYLRTR
jgi:hypothetical protein